VEVYFVIQKAPNTQERIDFLPGLCLWTPLGQKIITSSTGAPILFSKFTHMCAAYINARQFDKMMVIHDDT